MTTTLAQMIETFTKFKTYYSLFGYRGLFLPIRTKLARQPVELHCLPRCLDHPIYLRLKTSDIATYKKVFLDLEYEFPLGKVPAVIVDAGANVGFASIFFAKNFPKAKVLAVEPEISNFALLKKNVKPYPNILPIRCALWKENKTINLIDPGMGHWGFQAQDSSSTEQALVVEKIQGMTVDTLMLNHAIDYIDILKIDIEGGEKEIFDNASAWIGKIGVIMIELHDRLRPGCSRSFYLATRDFEIEDKKGENIFMARAGYVKGMQNQNGTR